MKVVIPCAGLGSRLGNNTKYYNKAMITVGKKPIISYIIEKFKPSDEIIILLGYKGELLKQIVEVCHPDYNITFINVDKYEGEGSGLGYSLHCAYDLLQEPFLFWTNDSLLKDVNISDFNFDENWIIVSKLNYDTASSYRCYNKQYNKILPKKNDNFTCDDFPYVGVSYIKDYNLFWDAYFKNKDLFISEGECCGLDNLSIDKYYYIENWVDTGNLKQLTEEQEKESNNMEEVVLPKPEEAIWFFDDLVIKFHIDEKFISDRVIRSNTLLNSNLIDYGFRIPRIVNYTKNTYTYYREKGEIASKIINTELFKKIIYGWLSNIEVDNVSNREKEDLCISFYKDKTLSRIQKYCTLYDDIDNTCYINGIKCISATEIINSLNWKELSKKCVITRNFHGDFHLENILVNDDKLILLDWRQNFNNKYIGDIYYDIAKMWHSVIVNHALIKKNLFSIDQKIDQFTLNFHREFIDIECEKILENLNYDINFAKLITSIIFLNISACHTYPYSKFLFYLGKYMLNQLIINGDYYGK